MPSFTSAVVRKMLTMTGKKGSGETIAAILMIFIVLAFAALYVSSVNAQINARIDQNLRETDIIKKENAFVFLNRSLGMTWYIHAVQSAFSVAGASVWCGYDESENEDIIPAGYWYYTNYDDPKNQMGLNDFLDNGEEKYNNFNPYVCYPSQNHLLAGMDGSFIALKSASEAILDVPFSANTVRATVKNVRHAMAIENEDPRNYNNTRDGLRVVVKGNITIGTNAIGPEIEKPNIDNNEVESNVKIFTPLPVVVEAGRLIVRNLAGISDFLDYTPSTNEDGSRREDPNYEKGYRYRDNQYGGIFNTFSDNSNVYYLGFINTSVLDSMPDIQGLAKTVRKTRLEYTFVEREAGGTAGDRLYTDYDYSVTYSDGTAFAGRCEKPGDEYLQLIRDAVTNQNLIWRFGDVEYTNDEIEYFIKAIIQQESGWNPYAVSRCGAAGLAQFMPGTANQYGLARIFEDAGFTACDDNYGARLAAAVRNLGGDDQGKKDLDHRLDPERAIPAMVRYINDVMNDVYNTRDYTDDREEILKLTAATYNTGPGNVNRAVQRSGADNNNVKFEEIKPFLAEETQDYVPSVMGNYICYGGILTSVGGSYYAYSPAADTFSKRPFSVTIKARDRLPAIDCAEDVYEGVDVGTLNYLAISRVFDWVTEGDGKVACCLGELYTCNYNLPGVPVSRQLSTGQAIGGDCKTQMTGLYNGDPNNPYSLVCFDGPSPLFGFVLFQFNAIDMTPEGCRQETERTACESVSECYWAGDDQRGACSKCPAVSTCSAFSISPTLCRKCGTGEASECVYIGQPPSGFCTAGPGVPNDIGINPRI